MTDAKGLWKRAQRPRLRPAVLDPPKVVPLADLLFERSAAAFTEGLARVALPLGRQAAVVDTALGRGALHVLSTGRCQRGCLKSWAVGP